ncbi:MAG: hypothetical protein ABR878_16745 [Roseiarcus sp.]|jgi:hypothetical protein
MNNKNPPQTVDTALSGYELLNDPLLNKGAAFTDAERELFARGRFSPSAQILSVRFCPLKHVAFAWNRHCEERSDKAIQGAMGGAL